MLKGIVKFHARIRGNGLTFPLFDFTTAEPKVEKVEIEGPKGDRILTSVYVSNVTTDDEGIAIAARVNQAALNRIAFFYVIAIEKVDQTGVHFSPLNPKPGVLYASGHFSLTGKAAQLVVGISAARLKTQLEQVAHPGEANFGLFRSARQSISSVEEFVHLYHILLMLFNDRQAAVDAFIRSEEPAVPLSQNPKKPKLTETIYTRLRNELAHKRPGIDLDRTKEEMTTRLSGLVSLTRRAIELNP